MKWRMKGNLPGPGRQRAKLCPPQCKRRRPSVDSRKYGAAGTPEQGQVLGHRQDPTWGQRPTPYLWGSGWGLSKAT